MLISVGGNFAALRSLLRLFWEAIGALAKYKYIR
jgi:hypothetical protein